MSLRDREIKQIPGTFGDPFRVVTTLPGGSGMRRITERAATVLPEPDSPTMPSVSLRSSVKLTPLTALTTPA